MTDKKYKLDFFSYFYINLNINFELISHFICSFINIIYNLCKINQLLIILINIKN